jgi:hypothetical protein
MAFSRKFQGKGQLGTSDTPIYAPTGSAIGTIGVLALYNTSASDQAEVTIYSPHTGTPDRILEKVVLNPEKSHLVRYAVNQVLEGSASYQISGLASVAATVDFTISGAEE